MTVRSWKPIYGIVLRIFQKNHTKLLFLKNLRKIDNLNTWKNYVSLLPIKVMLTPHSEVANFFSYVLDDFKHEKMLVNINTLSEQICNHSARNFFFHVFFSIMCNVLKRILLVLRFFFPVFVWFWDMVNFNCKIILLTVQVNWWKHISSYM